MLTLIALNRIIIDLLFHVIGKCRGPEIFVHFLKSKCYFNHDDSLADVFIKRWNIYLSI